MVAAEEFSTRLSFSPLVCDFTDAPIRNALRRQLFEFFTKAVIIVAHVLYRLAERFSLNARANQLTESVARDGY